MNDTEKILSAINSLRISINENTNKIDEIKKVTSETYIKLQSLEKEFDIIKKENEKLREINKQQSMKIRYLDREARCKNLIIYGFKLQSSDRAECLQQIVTFIVSNLKVECNVLDIVYFRKLGRGTGGGHILIKFDSERKMKELLSKRVLLKGTNYFLSEDYPAEVREERKVLHKWVKQEVENGNDARLMYNFAISNGKKVFCHDIVDQVPLVTRRMIRRRESDSDEKVITEDIRPSTPVTTKGTQLEQWLSTPDRKKTQQILKKKKKTGSAETPS